MTSGPCVLLGLKHPPAGRIWDFSFRGLFSSFSNPSSHDKFPVCYAAGYTSS